MQIDKEEAKKLAEDIYNQLLDIPCRLMKHKCGQPITKETAIANIFLTLLKEEHQTVKKENESILPQAVIDLRNFEHELAMGWIELSLDTHEKLYAAALCTRADKHESPCNGLPRKTCPQI